MSNLILSLFAAGLLAVSPSTLTTEPCLDIYGDAASIEICPQAEGLSWCHTSAAGDETCGTVEPIDVCWGDNCLFCDATSCGWSTPETGCSISYSTGVWETGCWGLMFGSEPDPNEGINLAKIPGLDLSIDLIESYGYCSKIPSSTGGCFVSCAGVSCICRDGWFTFTCMCSLSSKSPDEEGSFLHNIETGGWGSICK